MESKPGESFLSLQCKDKGEGGGLRILLVKIAIKFQCQCLIYGIETLAMVFRCLHQFSHTIILCEGTG